MSIKHAFVSAADQSGDTSVVSKNEWNALHVTNGPDDYPASPSAFDDEFDTLSGWTTLGTLDTLNVTDFPGHLHMTRRGAVSSVEANGVYKAAPTPPFVITTKVSDYLMYQNHHWFGIMLTDSTPTRLFIAGMIFSTNPFYTWGRWSSRTARDGNAESFGHWNSDQYYRLVVVNKTCVFVAISKDGQVWHPVYPGVSPGLTPANIGLAIVQWNTGINNMEATFDWLRVETPGTPLIPVMTSATAPSGTASQKTYYNNTNWQAWAAMGGNGSGTGWLSATGDMPTWIKYQFGSTTTATKYSLTPWWTDTYPGRTPKTWKLQGSNDDAAWTDLDSQTNWVPTLATLPVFTIASPDSYLYYRLYITANNGDSYTGLGSFMLYT